MKLWYQSLARQTESTPYGEILRATIAAAVDPGTTVDMRGVSQSAGIGVHYRFLEHHDMREVMFNAMQAEREGYDAFLIGNISDAGIREARECVNIPVLGLCETSLHMASIMGASFGLVTISPKWNLRIMENVQRYGLERRFAGMEAMNTSPIELKRAMIDLPFRRGIIDQFNIAAQKLLDKGAEIIIPAGGDIIVFLAEAHTYENRTRAHRQRHRGTGENGRDGGEAQTHHRPFHQQAAFLRPAHRRLSRTHASVLWC